jgi:hypothetical protein
MIRIHRNHPSIIVWSMDNEVFFTGGSTMPKVRELLKATVALTHELDPTRPAAIGGCQRGDIDKLGDVAGYNGDGARLFINPGIPSVVTEYGSTVADRPGKYEPGWGDLQMDPFSWRSGQALWCAFDHGSIAGHFGCMGMVDYFRLPKRQWYWYRNEYRHIPPPAWPSNGIPASLKLSADRTVLHRVDGTEDAQIIVTVVDQTGKAISNCPPVTLSVESGPGEFATGPAIRFAPDSDIAIRVGEAAAEFRSYYAGKSVIRATSPGLQSATIEIISQGEPRFIPGTTPPVKSRPYVRFAEENLTDATTRFGLENPTRASSEASGHSARLANDGNAATFWQAAKGDTNAWLCIDLERIVSISQIKLTFPTEDNWGFRSEISDDGITDWKAVTGQTQTRNLKAISLDAWPGVRGRFLRVLFLAQPAGKPARLAEVEATGKINVNP